MSNAALDIGAVSGFDIIGDVHGCAPALVALLKRLGYTQDGPSFRHPDRMAIFVGDIIDRGPYIRASLQIVKTMVEEGQALCILGNHEINAVIRCTEAKHEDADPRFLRDKTPAKLCENGQGEVTASPANIGVSSSAKAVHRHLDSETEKQFQAYQEEWQTYLSWFKTLPLFLDLDAFRVVHACWNDRDIHYLRQRVGGQNVYLFSVLDLLARGEEQVARSVDRLTRGVSLRYPEARYVVGQDGVKRSFFRTKFWLKHPQSYGDVAFQPDPIPTDLNSRTLDEAERARLSYYQASEKPLFFGHYWLDGKPEKQRENLACLDYSAVNYGRLVCYRFDGEVVLNDDKFVWAYVDPEKEFSL